MILSNCLCNIETWFFAGFFCFEANFVLLILVLPMSEIDYYNLFTMNELYNRY
jgi:hypothetical protein